VNVLTLFFFVVEIDASHVLLAIASADPLFPCHRTSLRIRAESAASTPSSTSSSWDHVLVAIVDNNPLLSTASRTAVDTAASLANHGHLTVMFLDDNDVQKEASPTRIELMQRQLEDRNLGELSFIEEKIEPSSGNGSVAVGEAADTLGADLVVLSTAAVHERHVDANLLAEFVPAPVLLLP